MDYTEQPFNLETALKHPEWVETRDGRGVDFIKEYPKKPNAYQVIVVMKNAEHFSYARNGLFELGKKSNNDLILRVPYRDIFVSIYPNGDAKWDEVNQPRKDCLICVPVKIPAI
jgi:hypothetical protein